MLKTVLTRLKNPKIATAVASGVILILVNTGVIDVEMSKKAEDIFNTLLSIGIAVGVFSTPEK